MIEFATAKGAVHEKIFAKMEGSKGETTNERSTGLSCRRWRHSPTNMEGTQSDMDDLAWISYTFDLQEDRRRDVNTHEQEYQHFYHTQPPQRSQECYSYSNGTTYQQYQQEQNGSQQRHEEYSPRHKAYSEPQVQSIQFHEEEEKFEERQTGEWLDTSLKDERKRHLFPYNSDSVLKRRRVTSPTLQRQFYSSYSPQQQSPPPMAQSPASMSASKVNRHPAQEEKKEFDEGRWRPEEIALLLYVAREFISQELKVIGDISFEIGVRRPRRAIDKQLKRMLKYDKWATRDLEGIYSQLTLLIESGEFGTLSEEQLCRIQTAKEFWYKNTFSKSQSSNNNNFNNDNAAVAYRTMSESSIM